MSSVFRAHSTRCLTDEVAKAREGCDTGAVAAGLPPGLWWGVGAETRVSAVDDRCSTPSDRQVRYGGAWSMKGRCDLVQ